MKIAYLDCHSGISGDMMLGALLDAGVPLEAIASGIESLGLPEVRVVVEEVKRCGFRAKHVRIEHPPEHAHRHLHHITKMIDGGNLSEPQKVLARRIFTRLGEAEAKVHGTTIQKVHFHEVGAVDSIADIVGSAIGIDLLGADRFVASPVPTGCGQIEIAHGRMNVPAPATAELLRGVPLAASSIEHELTTPTGAAILATIVRQFGPLPAMSVEHIGYGAGTRELQEQPNVLRLLVGQQGALSDEDQAWTVETNLDDSSGELIGHCISCLWEAGALDVATSSIQMKKNRPGVRLSVLCRVADLEKIEQIIFRETTALGVRRWLVSRNRLKRKMEPVQTPWGTVEGKVTQVAGRPPSFAPEYDACSRLAAEHNIPLREVYDAARRAWGASNRASE